MIINNYYILKSKKKNIVGKKKYFCMGNYNIKM